MANERTTYDVFKIMVKREHGWQCEAEARTKEDAIRLYHEYVDKMNLLARIKKTRVKLPTCTAQDNTTNTKEDIHMSRTMTVGKDTDLIMMMADRGIPRKKICEVTGWRKPQINYVIDKQRRIRRHKNDVPVAVEAAACKPVAVAAVDDQPRTEAAHMIDVKVPNLASMATGSHMIDIPLKLMINVAIS